MRKASDSTQLLRLRREMKQVVSERQTWATRAGAAERSLADLRFELAKVSQRLDVLLSRGAEGVKP